MTAPHRVLHVIDSLDLGGAQTFLLDLLRHLDRSRYYPEVAAMHGWGVYARLFEEAGVKTHSLSPGKWPPLYVPNFWRLMRGGKFDILHFHLFGANLCAKPLAIAAGHRAIVVHDQCNDASRDNNPVLLAADALANRGASRVIAVSKSIRRYLLDREELPDSRVEMIPNGIDAEMFRPADEDQKLMARMKLDLPPDRLLVGCVGRLVPQKNISLLLDLASRIVTRNPELIFVIAGTGPQEHQLREKVRSLNLSESVRFLGHVNDRIGLYRSLDVLVMTSDFEGTPMSLLEAMAGSLPVVASAVDGIADVCTDGWDSLLVPARDLDGFTAALGMMIQDRGLRKTLGENARVTVLRSYEIGGIARRIENLYDQVIAEQAGV